MATAGAVAEAVSSASVLAARRRLHLDAAGLVFGSGVWVFGGDPVAESAGLAWGVGLGVSLLAAVGAGFGSGLPAGEG